MRAYKNRQTHVALLMKPRRFLGLSILVLLYLFPVGDGAAGTLQDIKARGKLIAGVKTDYPPLGFLDKKGIHEGLDIDISKAVSKELFGNEYAVEFVSVTSENRIPLLTSGKVDLLAATLTITEERRKDVDFTIPYFITAQMILVRQDGKIKEYRDLAGKRVATINGAKEERKYLAALPEIRGLPYLLVPALS